MIISHKYRFIFIKTMKTAGTSVEIALSEFLGDDDICTPLADADENTRRNLGYKGARNYFVPLSGYRMKNWKKLLLKRKRLRYYTHSSASRVRRLVGNDIWNSYFKFCFERNPWDKTISAYYWRISKGGTASLTDFIRDGAPDRLAKRGGSGLYTINGKIAMDRVCLYENMAEEMGFIAKKLNLPGIPRLPNAKSGTRKDKRHYRDVLTDDDRLCIHTAFATEIKNFGYKF